jgi:alkylation response protein AidB-like acyl-CoA dehydrogenase
LVRWRWGCAQRWGFIVQANRFARVCIEESMAYAMKRRTFGKKLIEHQVLTSYT